MKTKKSIYVVLVEPHHNEKDNKASKDMYQRIFQELINSDMHVVDYAFSCLLDGSNFDYLSSGIVDDMDDFMFNPFGNPKLESEIDEELDDVELLIRESFKINQTDQSINENDAQEYPDGNFIYLQVVSDKQLFEMICNILSEYGLEEENVELVAFKSNHASFFNFQGKLMKPLKKKNNTNGTLGLPGGANLN